MCIWPLFVFLMVSKIDCWDTIKRKSMENVVDDMQGGKGRKLIRRENIIQTPDNSITFKIPDTWVKWYEENEDRPNLHLTPNELNTVKEAEGEWDKEFARVINAILPFEECLAHIGSEGWGERALSFADLQVRLYIVQMTFSEIENNARSKGLAMVSSITGQAGGYNVEQSDVWKKIKIEYRLVYQDYSAISIVDMRIRQLSDKSVVFVFMYTDYTDHSGTINDMLDSLVIN